jgi:hypothetical protein
MASEVARLIYKKTGVQLNIKQNHIKCFCHKIALILNAGLKALEVASEGIRKTKQSTLGFYPGLGTISEKSDDIFEEDDENQFGPNDKDELEAEEADEEDENEIGNSDDESISEETMSKSKSYTAQVLKKVRLMFLIIIFLS